jgi:transcriptional regulator with PAS, ATPase and Fis domain
MTDARSTLTSPRRAIPSAQSLLRLRIVHPSDVVIDIALDAPEITLGREQDQKVTVVSEPTVSRRHLTLRSDRATHSHLLTDLDSHNGTFVDGAAATPGQPVAVQPGAVIRFGDVLAVLEEDVDEDSSPVARDAIVGDSGPTRALRARIARAATDPSPALLVGATGTGKEIVAEELHRLSDRGDRLVSVNCAALGGQLVESELFGHVKGAFTGATGDHPGLFRAASGGTIFLDEIGDLPLELQPKLLRAIETREVRAVGSTTSHRVDVRVLAATNRDLQEMVSAGTFRRDLYARLSLWLLKIPTLRERISDLFDYVRIIHQAWLAERGRDDDPLSFDADAAEALLLHAWDDNLRGLVRLVHEVAEAERPITAAALPDWLLEAPEAPEAQTPAPAPESKPEPPTRDELVELLRTHNGSIRAVAKQLHRHRNQIYRWMKALDISRDDL